MSNRSIKLRWWSAPNVFKGCLYSVVLKSNCNCWSHLLLGEERRKDATPGHIVKVTEVFDLPQLAKLAVSIPITKLWFKLTFRTFLPLIEHLLVGSTGQQTSQNQEGLQQQDAFSNMSLNQSKFQPIQSGTKAAHRCSKTHSSKTSDLNEFRLTDLFLKSVGLPAVLNMYLM